MRCKRVITVDETYTLPDYRDTHAVDFSGESDALTPGNAVSWANNSKSTSHIAWSDPCVRGDKYRACARQGAIQEPALSRSLEMLSRIDEIDNVSELMQLFVPADSPVDESK